MNKTKIIITLVILLAIAYLIKITLGTTFLFSSDGWNKTEREINSSNVLLKGSGFEPGWAFTIRGENLDQDNFGADLTLNYGERQFSGIFQKGTAFSQATKMIFIGKIAQVLTTGSSTTLSTTDLPAELEIDNAMCTDPAGRTHGLSASFKFENQTIYACADLGNTTQVATTTTSIANPASENCLSQGGFIKMETKADGRQYGLCYFDDNRACEEWAMFRGECPVGGVKTTGYDTLDQKYCAWTGGRTTAVEGSICTLKNGTACPTIDLYEGKCK